MDRVAPLPAVGEVLAGKFRVERELGQGSLGPVFGAVHVGLDQPVAIKFLRPSLVEHKVISKRFLQEARAAASIRSEHVGRVLDLSVTEQGVPYMVMEALYGTDLAELLRERSTLPIEEAAKYLLQVCDAMAEAHALGIVHRDLKPENFFLITRADGTQIVKVLDFGVSKASVRLARLQARDGEDGEGTAVTTVMTHPTRPTDTNAIVGSLAYMAPEQIASAKVVDARADIWSIGIILYELLTGKLPFTGGSEAALARAILLDPPPVLRSVVPDAPEKIEELIAKCLEKEPEKRLGDIAQVRAVLVEFASKEARAAASLPRTYAAGTRADDEFARRRRGIEASGVRSGAPAVELSARAGAGSRDAARARLLTAGIAVTIAIGAAAFALTPSGPHPPAVMKLADAVDASGWAAVAAAHARDAARPPASAARATIETPAVAPPATKKAPDRADHAARKAAEAPPPSSPQPRDHPAPKPMTHPTPTAATPARTGGSPVDPLATAD